MPPSSRPLLGAKVGSQDLRAPSLSRPLANEWDANLSPSHVPSDRAGLYAALAMATCIGPYLYTRFYIPDILIALWMTLAVHFLLIALDRIHEARTPTNPGAPEPCPELAEGSRF